MSNSLPKTSYVKMIDIWLLFNLTIPFAEVMSLNLFLRRCHQPKNVQVLLQTYIEYLRGLVEEKSTINHHGKEVHLNSDTDPPISSSAEKSQVFVLP